MATKLRMMEFEFDGTHRETGEKKKFYQNSTWMLGAYEKLMLKNPEWRFEY